MRGTSKILHPLAIKASLRNTSNIQYSNLAVYAVDTTTFQIEQSRKNLAQNQEHRDCGSTSTLQISKIKNSYKFSQSSIVFL